MCYSITYGTQVSMWIIVGFFCSVFALTFLKISQTLFLLLFVMDLLNFFHESLNI